MIFLHGRIRRVGFPTYTPCASYVDRVFTTETVSYPGIHHIGDRDFTPVIEKVLHLGIKNILLGPSLPAFVSPNVLGFLVENYNIGPISTPEADMAKLLGK